MAASNASLGAFGQLPPEIRNLMYGFALTSPGKIEISRYRVVSPLGAAYYSPKYGPKSKVETWHGKRKSKPAASKVLAVNLLRASKAVNAEATPVLYGLNCFAFENAHALSTFMPMIGERAALLTDVEFGAFSLAEVATLNRMASPKAMTIEAGSNTASTAWHILKPIFQTRRLYLPDWENFVVELPLELQLRRFEGVKFTVSPNVTFQVNGQAEKIEDQEERGRRYKELVRRLLVKEAEEWREAKEMEEKVIAEMLGASRAVRKLEG